MERTPFSQVLKNASVDIRREYARLYLLFFKQNYSNESKGKITLKDVCANGFLNLPFRGTCISLSDFDDFYGYHFKEDPEDFDLNYLLSFCEYSYNLAIYNQGFGLHGYYMGNMYQPVMFFINQVNDVIESIGYMANRSDKGITDFVPKDQSAIAVSEIVDPSLSYKVIEYNHRSMNGDLEKKKAVILALAEKLEPMQKKLRQINSSIESDLFYLLNNANLRHNNVEPGKKQNPSVAAMEKVELERWYDDTYQLCLLAFLELDNIERKKRIDELKKRNQV